MIRLVVNAEELGTTPASDRRVVTAHREGIVTSASIAGNCADLAAVRATLAEAPALGAGLSLALIGGAPVAPPGQIRSLLTEDGVLRARTRDFAIDWWKRAIQPADVETELEAQISRARAAGLVIDHLGTRGHIGLLPGVGEIVERVAIRHHIAGIRTTVEPPTLGWITDPARGAGTGLLGGLAWLTRRKLGSLRHGPRTWGHFESGRLDEVRIVEMLGRLDPGAHEILCHPGAIPAQAGAPDELAALTSPKVKRAVEQRNITLCRWQDLF